MATKKKKLSVTRHIAGKIDGVPFIINGDPGAEKSFECARCGRETKPTPGDFRKEHGSECPGAQEEKASSKKSGSKKSSSKKS